MAVCAQFHTTLTSSSSSSCCCCSPSRSSSSFSYCSSSSSPSCGSSCGSSSVSSSSSSSPIPVAQPRPFCRPGPCAIRMSAPGAETWKLRLKVLSIPHSLVHSGASGRACEIGEDALHNLHTWPECSEARALKFFCTAVGSIASHLLSHVHQAHSHQRCTVFGAAQSTQGPKTLAWVL